MHKEGKFLQHILELLVILMIVTSVVMFVQQIPTSTNISMAETENPMSNDSFISAYTTHDPILIQSNADFSAQGFSGSGTVADPYVIEGFNITTAGTCISIQDTDAYFEIRDCLLIGGVSGIGVAFENVDNGAIRNNTISGNTQGVSFTFSTDNTIEGNNISGNQFGVSFYYSSDNALSSNIFVNNSIYITGDRIEYWRQNITTDNILNGLTVGYFWNLTSGTIDGTQYGQVILANCTGVTVVEGVFNSGIVGIILGHSSYCTLVNNTISENNQGVSFSYSSYNTMKGNNIFGNSFGVSVFYSSDNTIEGNNISGNQFGVIFDSSSNNIVVNNTIFRNGVRGIIFYSSPDNKVENNNISGNSLGVYFQESSDNTIEGNNISGNQYGMSVCYSSDNIVVNNTIFRNEFQGITFYTSPDNKVENNNISGNSLGVYFHESSDNALSSNIFVNNGIYITGDRIEYWRQNITIDNIVNELTLGYFWNLTSDTIDGTQYGQVILANCTGVTVEDGVFSNSSTGIILGYSSYCTLVNNTISENSYDGVDLFVSSDNEVVNSTISGNYRGVAIYDSSRNTIVNNTISRNDQGVFIDYFSSNNHIYLNIFADNEIGNAYDEGTNNHWNTTRMGNYWSNYNGTGVYHIPGGADSIDYHPFIYPPETTVPSHTLSTVEMTILAIAILFVTVLIIEIYRGRNTP